MSSSSRYFVATLKKSYAGQKEIHLKTLRALGLRRIGASVQLPDTPANRGMLYKVNHMVAVTAKEGVAPPSKRTLAKKDKAQA